MSELPKPPRGFKDGVIAESRPDGFIRVILVRNGRSEASTSMRPAAVSGIAYTVLMAAKMHQDRKGTPLPAAEEIKMTMDVSTIGLATSPKPGHETLALRFGEAQLGIDIPHHALRALGEAMIAASADPSTRN